MTKNCEIGDITLSKKKIAKHLSVHHNTVTNLLKRGTLKGTTVVDLIEFEKEKAVAEFIEAVRSQKGIIKDVR